MECGTNGRCLQSEESNVECGVRYAWEMEREDNRQFKSCSHCFSLRPATVGSTFLIPHSSKAPGGLRLLLLLLLLSVEHLFSALHGHTVEEGLDAASLLVDVPLGTEVQTRAHDVLRGREILLAECALGLQSDLERAEAVEYHALRGVQVTVHYVDELDEHGRDVRVLHGDILLNLLGYLLGAESLGVDGAAKELALVWVWTARPKNWP